MTRSVRTMKEVPRHSLRLLFTVVATSAVCATASGAVTLLGVQYQQDDPMPEFDCIWYDPNYPSCVNLDYPFTGSNVHVYLRNDGASSVTVNDATLAGYSLNTVIKLN